MTVRRVVPNITSARAQETRSFYETLGLETQMDMGWIATLVSPCAVWFVRDLVATRAGSSSTL